MRNMIWDINCNRKRKKVNKKKKLVKKKSEYEYVKILKLDLEKHKSELDKTFLPKTLMYLV